MATATATATAVPSKDFRKIWHKAHAGENAGSVAVLFPHGRIKRGKVIGAPRKNHLLVEFENGGRMELQRRNLAGVYK